MQHEVQWQILSFLVVPMPTSKAHRVVVVPKMACFLYACVCFNTRQEPEECVLNLQLSLSLFMHQSHIFGSFIITHRCYAPQ